MWESQSGIQVGVIDRLKRSKTLSNVELVKNSKNPQSCLEIRPIQKSSFHVERFTFNKIATTALNIFKLSFKELCGIVQPSLIEIKIG